MERNRIITTITLAAALAMTACTQDELADGGDILPPGKYPLEIGSVTLSVESSEQPWGAKSPQTRVSENTTDGNSSYFNENDKIGVSFGGKTAVYTYNGSAWESDTPLYWESTQPATVTAWYPVGNEVDLTQQDQGLAYMMNGQAANVTYNTAANITLNHLLAKVRVVLKGDKASEVASVSIYCNPTGTRDENGAVSGSGNPAYYPMHKTSYTDIGECWEANVVPGTLVAANSLQVAREGGESVQVTLNGNVNLVAGAVNTIAIDVQQKVTEIDLSTYEGTTLTVSGKTIIKGDGTKKNLQITVEPNADITLQDVNLAYTGQAVIVCEGDASLTFSGTNTLIGTPVAFNFTSGSGVYIKQGTLTIDAEADASLSISRTYTIASNTIAGMGIYVGENANLVIKNGNISIGDAPEDDSSGPGIGNLDNCGSITIEGGTVTVGTVSWHSPGIGSKQGTYKDISITGENTVVNVQKGQYSTYYIGYGNFGSIGGTITIGGGATVNGTKYTETHTGPL